MKSIISQFKSFENEKCLFRNFKLKNTLTLHINHIVYCHDYCASSEICQNLEDFSQLYEPFYDSIYINKYGNIYLGSRANKNQGKSGYFIDDIFTEENFHKNTKITYYSIEKQEFVTIDFNGFTFIALLITDFVNRSEWNIKTINFVIPDWFTADDIKELRIIAKYNNLKIKRIIPQFLSPFITLISHKYCPKFKSDKIIIIDYGFDYTSMSIISYNTSTETINMLDSRRVKCGKKDFITIFKDAIKHKYPDNELLKSPYFYQDVLRNINQYNCKKPVFAFYNDTHDLCANTIKIWYDEFKELCTEKCEIIKTFIENTTDEWQKTFEIDNNVYIDVIGENFILFVNETSKYVYDKFNANVRVSIFEGEKEICKGGHVKNKKLYIMNDGKYFTFKCLKSEDGKISDSIWLIDSDYINRRNISSDFNDLIGIYIRKHLDFNAKYREIRKSISYYMGYGIITGSDMEKFIESYNCPAVYEEVFERCKKRLIEIY